MPGEGVPWHSHNGAQGKGVRQQHGGGRVRTEQSHVQEHCRPPIGTGGGVSAPPHTAEHQAEMLAARRGFAPPSPRPQAVPVQSAALPAHCCLHVESLRILLLAEQALREGLEEALARRSALDLVLSCPGSVPFMQTALGSPRPRLCPFCPASSSGTCPARERSVRPWQRPPRWSASALRHSGQRRRKLKAKGEQFHAAPAEEGRYPAAGTGAQLCALQWMGSVCSAGPIAALSIRPAQCSDSAPGARGPQERRPSASQLMWAPVTSLYLGSDSGGSLTRAGGAPLDSHCTAAPWG